MHGSAWFGDLSRLLRATAFLLADDDHGLAVEEGHAAAELLRGLLRFACPARLPIRVSHLKDNGKTCGSMSQPRGSVGGGAWVRFAGFVSGGHCGLFEGGGGTG